MLGELNLDQIENVLTNNLVGRIGCYADGKIYIVPMTYVYDGESVIGYSVEGMKISMLRKNPKCCFEVDQTDNMSNWQSVITWGLFEELKGEEANYALQKLEAKLKPIVTSETSYPQAKLQLTTNGEDFELQHSIIYRIQLREKTGRFERR